MGFYISKENLLYNHDNKVSIVFFEWTPIEKGNYKVTANVVDKFGFKVSYTKQFAVT